MKLKKLIGLSLATVMAATGFALASCDDPDDGGKATTYTMEAEYINLDGVSGAGVSSDQSGVEMIYGDATDAQKALGWSNGYFVGYTYASNLTLEFVFNAETAGTATIILRLGSELGDINLDPSVFAVKLNGENITYSNMFVEGSLIEEMKFTDKTVTTTANLKQGENKISLVVLTNTLMNGTKTGGPCVDCVKIETTSKLTWTDKTDNPSRRGAIE